MSDVRMAELLRRYLASGDPDTGARLLQERLRTGAVTSATLVAAEAWEADRLALGAARAATYARGAWVRCGGCGSSPPCSSCGRLPETSGLLVAIDAAVRSWVVFGSM